MKIAFLLIFMFLLTACDDKKQDKDYKPTGVIVGAHPYIVGIHPYLNSKKLYLSYRPILNHLEENIPEARFELQTASDYGEYEKKLYSGAFDFALPNPYQTVNSIELGYTVIAKMKPDDVFRGIIVARKSLKIKNVEDIKGKTVSFPAPTALAATMMPLYFLHEKGLNVKKDIKPVYVGSQFSSILNAYTGDAYVAATWPPPWEQWKAENPEMAKEMSVIWATKPLVNNGFIVKNSVDTAVASKVADLLVGLGKSEKGMKMLARAGFEGFEHADNKTYEPVKSFLREYDRAIGLPK